MTIKVFRIFLLAAFPVATVSAQEWIELETLTFVPTRIEAPVSAGAAAARPESDSPGTETGLPISAVGQSSTRNTGDSSPQFVLAEIQAATDAIEAERERSGENSASLVPLLTELAEVYREIGDFGDAMAVLEQAQQIVRRWEGLYTLDQAAVIERMIEIRMEIAPDEGATELESYLRELIQRNPGDSRNVGLLIDMAGRQMDVARYVLVNGVPPEVVLNIDAGVGPGGPRFSQPRTTRSVATSALRRARANFGRAMNEAMGEGATDLPLLFELEGDIIDTFYFELMNEKLRRRNQPYNVSGQLRFSGLNALEAKLANSRLYPGTPKAITAAWLEVADWHLMFLGFGRAMEIYDSALGYLREHDADGDQVAAMFSPERPVPLPAFVADANVFSGLSNVHGHFDVEIEINRFGGVRNMRVTGRSGAASPAIERRLKRHVYQSRFRPRYADGEWQRRDRFSIRYEFGYKTS